ncbi:hypothetical protein [Kitasatospora cinereorecta]|uniref:Uncharacterized protein n=1 Tax=Kitasatospora cinereorecta TaxID=285560 RepID=A0ABW0VNM6_9ACTN
MESNNARTAAGWARPRAEVLTALMGAAALGWTIVALSVHQSALSPDGAADAALERIAAGTMAAVAAVAALLWNHHRVAARRPGSGAGRAWTAFAVSAAHLVPTLPVIALAPWGWKAPLIALTAAVVTCGVREIAASMPPAAVGANRPVTASG